MPENKIENLQQVLSEHIGKGKKITDVKTTPLTAPGENYGSIMLKLDVSLVNENDIAAEDLHAVAKTLPADEVTRKIFNVQVTFKNEIAMYATIMPTLQAFQREHGVEEVIDCYPKLYGARINLDGESNTVDENAAIVLENLRELGYSNVDRYQGFDLETAQLILKDLATFHAVPLALKIKNQEVFDTKVRPYLTPFKPPPLLENPDSNDSLEEVLVEIFQESHKCIPFIPKIRKALQRLKDAASLDSPRETFATVTHGDMWVNNTMVKFENGKPVKNKILDFQVCDYKSPATDVFFFLFTSVKKSVLEDDLDELIKLYHSHFISHLERLGCDVGPFDFGNFLEEMRLSATTELTHALIMIVLIILGKEGGFSVGPNHNEPPDFDKMRKNIRPDAKEKVQFMVEVCGEKGWL